MCRVSGVVSCMSVSRGTVGRPPNDGNAGRIHSYAMQRCAVQPVQRDVHATITAVCMVRAAPLATVPHRTISPRLESLPLLPPPPPPPLCTSQHPTETSNLLSTPPNPPCPSSDLFARCGPSARPVSSPPTPPPPLSPHPQNPPGRTSPTGPLRASSSSPPTSPPPGPAGRCPSRSHTTARASSRRT